MIGGGLFEFSLEIATPSARNDVVVYATPTPTSFGVRIRTALP